MRNFDYLQNIEELSDLYDFCSTAEEMQRSKPKMSAMNARLGLEWLVRTIYTLKHKEIGEKDKLFELMQGAPFYEFIADDRLMMAAHYVRKIGNIGAHIGDKVSTKESYFALLNLYNVVGASLLKLKVIDNLAPFDKNLIPDAQTKLCQTVDDSTKVPQPTQQFVSQVGNAAYNPASIANAGINISEAETRKNYIDLMIREAKWEILEQEGKVLPGKACIEVEVQGMPNQQQKGYCDYVLFGDDGKPLAVIEAKKTMVDALKGRQQACLYAECLKKQYGVKPVIYYTNGFKTYIIDGLGYPERVVMGFHSKNDLEWLIQQRSRGGITDMKVNESITNRAYQKQAIKAVCEHFDNMHRRGLLVMATGTGKTRVSISLTDVLMRNGWIKNILFLADRTALVKQAQKNYAKLLPAVTTTILSEEKDPDSTARMVFSTYQTMINYIDRADKPFTIGRFDLVIIDEAHRSVFGKYTAILSYFDALMVGLTATPREEVDRSTYELFNLDEGSPNMAYELDEAVKDGFLVPHTVLNRTTEIMRAGIRYDSLTAAEKQQMEDIWTYEKAKGILSGSNRDIEKSEINKYIFNKDTIDKVLQDLMENGLKINSGETIGKTIIFAASHKHAELIVERFNYLYPELAGENSDFCLLIDNYVNYAQSLVEKFEVRGKMPQIAVSVDMLDTGVDVPDILNLVFFKPVHSKIKFWQMVGRGTRLSEGIFDDKSGKEADKKEFYIFDWCGNCEYFSHNGDGAKPVISMSLTERLFDIQCELVQNLQDAKWQTQTVSKQVHDELKDGLHGQVNALSSDFISVRQNWSTVEKYKKKDNWVCLSKVDVEELKAIIAPILKKGTADSRSKTFDILIYQIELSLADTNVIADKVKAKVSAIAELLLKKASIPQVLQKVPLLEQVALPTYWDDLSFDKLEHTRKEMRDLIQFLVGEPGQNFTIDIEDTIEYGETKPGSAPKMTYKQRIVDYLAKNKDLPVLSKIMNIEPLSFADVQELERICWEELGSKEEYHELVESGKMLCGDSVAAFIRSQIGVDRVKAKQKLSAFIQHHELNSSQEEYISQVLEYVCKNGDITPATLINDAPFSNFDLISLFGADIKAIGSYVNSLHTAIEGNLALKYATDEPVSMAADPKEKYGKK